jgi:hypothetical protein
MTFSKKTINCLDNRKYNHTRRKNKNHTSKSWTQDELKEVKKDCARFIRLGITSQSEMSKLVGNKYNRNHQATKKNFEKWKLGRYIEMKDHNHYLVEELSRRLVSFMKKSKENEEYANRLLDFHIKHYGVMK